MTPEECTAGLKVLWSHVQKYVKLLVLQGVTLEPGQELVLECPIERVDFAREIVNVAYASGASHVAALWHDDSIEQMAYQNEPLANFENLPEWRKVQLNSLAEQGSGFLSIEGQDPEIFKGIDTAESAVAARSSHMQLKAFHEGMSFWRSTSCIAAASIRS